MSSAHDITGALRGKTDAPLVKKELIMTPVAVPVGYGSL